MLVDNTASGQWLDGQMEGLVAMVSGDTLHSLMLQASKQRSTRPLALELLTSMLARATAMNKSEWQILRVAVVAVRDGVFVSRAFFGASTQEKV